MKQAIKERSSLAQYPQVGLFLERIISEAQAGGMSNEECETLWDRIMGCLGYVDGCAFWTFRQEVTKLLSAPDALIEMADSMNPYRSNERWN